MGLKGLVQMKQTLLTFALAASGVTAAHAADLPMVTKAPPAPMVQTSMFDIAFGTALMTDYNFRGVSQSDRGPSVFGYFEPRFKITPNIELYAGIAGYSTKLPTTPTGEFDIYGGIRPTFGPVTFDFSAMYYAYPRETQVFVVTPLGPAIYDPAFIPFSLANTDFLEIYGKVTWTVNPYVTVGGGVYYTDDFLNTGADGTYVNGTLKLTAPSAWFPSDYGAFVSAEIARYWFGVTDNPVFPGVALPDYTYWNVGIAFTYKALTVDLRYHDTDLNRAECFTLTGDLRGLIGGKGPLGQSKWCGEAFIAKVAFDTTLGALK